MQISRFVLAWLAVAAAGGGAAAAQEAPASRCDALPGMEMLLKRPERFLFFGETHGVNETYQAFGEAVCEAAKRGPVIVGLEWPETLRLDFNTFIRSGDDAVSAMALDAVMKQNATPDGRGGTPMRAMFDRLREMVSAGAEITVVPFARYKPLENPPGGVQIQDDGPYARALLERAGESARVLVLVGSIHSMREEITISSTRVIPMAVYFPKDDTLSLNFASSGGSHWACIPDQGQDDITLVRIVCRERALRERPGEAGITFYDAPKQGHDGQWHVGPATASRPDPDFYLPPDSQLVLEF